MAMRDRFGGWDTLLQDLGLNDDPALIEPNSGPLLIPEGSPGDVYGGPVNPPYVEPTPVEPPPVYGGPANPPTSGGTEPTTGYTQPQSPQPPVIPPTPTLPSAPSPVFPPFNMPSNPVNMGPTSGTPIPQGPVKSIFGSTQSPKTGSYSRYRPQLKRPNDNYWRGWGSNLAGKGNPGARIPTAPSPYGELRIGGYSGPASTLDGISEERKRKEEQTPFFPGFGG